MSQPNVYSADEVTLAIAGIPIRSGLADGEFVRIEEDNDAFGDVAGTDGEVTRFKNSDRRATVTVLLMQSSAHNDELSALYNLDVNAPNGAGIGPFLLRDRSGRALYRAAACWIAKAPNVSFGREPGPREWKIRVAKLERRDGGN